MEDLVNSFNSKEDISHNELNQINDSLQIKYEIFKIKN